MEGIWKGRRGTVILGPTEDRVARYLDAATRYGRVTLRTMQIAGELQLERSEAYRILARLRVLGLFGIENDQGGQKGGRRIWRTRTLHDGGALHDGRHREAWSRIVAWSRGRRDATLARLRDLRQSRTAAIPPAVVRPTDGPSPAQGGPSVNFRDAMRRYGAGGLLDAWGIG